MCIPTFIANDYCPKLTRNHFDQQFFKPYIYTLSHHKAFTNGLGLDAMSLAWLAVVQLVVSFNSGLQWGISQQYTLFRHSDRFDFVFTLRCID